MPNESPSNMRRTMIKSTVGTVKHPAYDLPNHKDSSYTYGYLLPRDPESAGQVISKWVEATPSPAAQSGRSFVETNRQAVTHGYITPAENRKFAAEHPEILVKTGKKKKRGGSPRTDMVYGVKSKPSEDVSALVQARHTDFRQENSVYPDLSGMRVKGKLPLPRETRSSVYKDVRLNERFAEKDPGELFKMSKFKKVDSVYKTQPTHTRSASMEDDENQE